MTARELVEVLVESDEPLNIEALLDEASVYLPRRGSRWVATFRDESGRQIWRTTGLTNRAAALGQARKWEAGAKRRRAAQGPGPRKPTIRVRAGSAEQAIGLMTQREVAAIMRISERAVREIERRAFEKLRRHPALKQFWREWMTGEVEEAALGSPEPWTLSFSEIDAIYALARTPEEQQALRKLLILTQGGSR
jgi:hypothetical protein